MEHMKKVTRYQCQFCKKDFKTPNRHHCKFNPELKNCFTCKHCKGWHEGKIIDVGFGPYNGPYEPPYPDCNVSMSGWNIEDIKACSYNMQCSGYEEGKFDWSTYKESE